MKVKTPFLLMIASVLVIVTACKKESVAPLKIAANVPGDPIELPFDDFWFSTKFGIDRSSTDPPYYFNNSVGQHEGNNGVDLYNYGISDDFTGTIPKGCSRIYQRDGNTITATVTCALPLKGKVNPNGLQWEDSLRYVLTMKADITQDTITSAIIIFTDYNQTIDFTAWADFTASPDQINLGGGDYIVPTADKRFIHLSAIFTERLK